MSGSIEIKFDNRQQSIEFFRAFGMKHTVAALEAAEAGERAEEVKAQPGGAFAWTPEELEQLEASAAYLGLYALAAAVDAWLAQRGHLRDCRGRVIMHFDEWLRAAEAGEWVNGL